MISSSPDVTPLEHPIYDLWLLDCSNDKTLEVMNQISRFDSRVLIYHNHRTYPPEVSSAYGIKQAIETQADLRHGEV